MPMQQTLLVYKELLIELNFQLRRVFAQLKSEKNIRIRLSLYIRAKQIVQQLKEVNRAIIKQV